VGVGVDRVEEFALEWGAMGVVFGALEDKAVDDSVEEELEELETVVEDAVNEEFEGCAEKKQLPNPL
jgi:hypothetical protein